MGQRSALEWSWDVFDRPSELRLPSGVGRDAGGAFTGFSRGYDTLDRLISAGSLGGADPSPTALGADWQWGGLSRLYAMTTRGALGTGMRLGYHGGAGPSAPAGAGGTAVWKLGRMSWGAAAGSGPTDAPATPWGDLAFGWRGHDGLASDGAKLGRQVLGSSSSQGPGLLAGQGWGWGYDAGVRMTVAESGSGSLVGASTESGAAAADRFTYSYGTGDELLWSLRRETGELASYTSGPYGRIETREGVAFDHDSVGRRLTDDRFTYRWDWRGQLVEVTVHDTWPDENQDGEPDLSPYAGHRVRYDYDARGRLLRRLHEGELTGDGSRPFVEERRYVWEMDRLAAETAYGAPGTGVGGDGAIRWRKTFVPGPSGLDDAPQVVVEVYQPGPYTGTTSTYTYVTDEMGTTLAVVAEDEGGTATEPPVPVRYLYTPYGQAHAETGPELLRARFDATATSVDSGTGGAVTQGVPDTTQAAPGALVLTWSSPIAESSLPAGLHVELLAAGEGWVPVPADELAVGTTSSSDPLTDTSTELRVLRIWGWQEATSYRVRLTPELADRLGRPFGRSETLQWTVPAAPSEEDDVPPPQYEQRYPRRYESYDAAGATAGGRFPGGQSRLFQGLWTDPVTGISYARARWLDTRTGAWLSEDPLGAVDSPNLYAFVGWQPTMATDPLGLYCWECRDAERRREARLRERERQREDFETLQGAVALVAQLEGEEGVKTHDIQLALHTYLKDRPNLDRRVRAGLIAALTGSGEGNGAVIAHFEGSRYVAQFFEQGLINYPLMVAGGEAVIGARGLFLAIRQIGFRNAAGQLGQVLRSGFGSEAPGAARFATPGRFEGVRELSRILREAGVPRSARLEAINSFRNGEIILRRATGGENVLRYFGGDANRLGRFVTDAFPQGDARTLLALPSENTATGLTQFTLREGAVYFEGTVAPNFGLPGGGRQIFVPNLDDLLAVP